MPEAVIVSALRTPIGTARKGTLRDTTAFELAEHVIKAAAEGLDPERVDDVIMAEGLAGGGVIGRHAAITAGLVNVPGLAVNRHCAASLSAVAAAAGSIRSGMDDLIIAGGTSSGSTAPRSKVRRRGEDGSEEWVDWYAPTHPNRPDAPNFDMSLTIGWGAALAANVSREEMDAWALRSHRNAIRAIDEGRFKEEIVPIQTPHGLFAVDEHPRRDTTMDRLAGLKVLHPEIEGFSITAGNSSGTNDAAAALTLADQDFARSAGLKVLGSVKAWASVGVEPKDTGLGAVKVIGKILDRAGLAPGDVTLWEINEAFASVPIAACREYGLDEDLVNIYGSGCSLGHPIAASGARMLTTLVHELGRRGGGIGVAAMCAGGGQGGAVVIEV